MNPCFTRLTHFFFVVILFCHFAATRAVAQSPTPGNALVLDGTTNGFVHVTGLNGNNAPFTMEAWVKYTGGSYPTGYSTIIEFGQHSPQLAVTNSGKLVLYNSSNATAGGTVPLNTWTHVAASWDGTTSRLYVNGIQVVNTNAAPLLGGADMGIGYGFGDKPWVGQIDEVRMWNVARSSTQIATNINRSLKASDQTGLAAYYSFDETSGSIASDGIGNGNNFPGTLGSGASRVVSGVPFIPAAYTSNATSVAITSATLNGAATPNNLFTSVFFEWGTTTNYGNTTSFVDVGSGGTNVSVSIPLSGLTNGITYHYRMVAVNSAGTTTSKDQYFITRSFIVTTLANSGIGSLREAIDNSFPGAVISFATNGTIVLTSGELFITNDLTIIGNGPTDNIVSGNNQSRVFNITNSPVVGISGLTIRDGKATNGYTIPIGLGAGRGAAGQNGGGVYIGGYLTLSNCHVLACVAGDGGDGTNINPSVVVAAHGGAGGSGGGIFVSDGYLHVVSSIISSNIAGNGGLNARVAFVNNTGGDGGGIFGACLVESSLICFNRAGSGGAGAGGSGVNTNVNPLAHAGSYGGAGGSGGGVYLGTLSNCTVFGNRSGGGGGGGGGGAVGFRGSDGTTGDGNIGGLGGTGSTGGNAGKGGPGGQGGGVYGAVLIGCTVVSNLAGSGGGGGDGASGGIGGLPGAGGGVGNGGQLLSSICSINTGGIGGVSGFNGGASATNSLAHDVSGTFNSLGHNLIGKSEGSTGFAIGVNSDIVGNASFPINPLLGPLADNGGPTPTLALLAGSPAIDAGDDSLTGTDQRGFPRKVGNHVDVGAYESPFVYAYPPDLNGTDFFQNQIRITFPNAPGATNFHILASTNVALPITNWLDIGAAVEISPGLFQFTDPYTTNFQQRFYRVKLQ